MNEGMVGVGGGRLAIVPQWASVEKVYRSDPKRGPGWLCSGRISGGAPYEKARVVGPRQPRVGTRKRPSWGVLMFLAGNIYDGIFWPCPWVSATRDDIESHDLLDVFERLEIHIEGGTYSIKSPKELGGSKYLQIVEASGDDDPGRVVLLTGANRVARGPSQEGAPTGDYVAIDSLTSPAFVAWILAVDAYVRPLVGGGMPPLPLDPIPQKDDQPPVPAEAVQVVGQIVTGSPYVKGR